MSNDPYVGDLSTKWVVSLAENEVGFDTKDAAETFISFLKQQYPDLHFVLCPPKEKVQ